MAILMIPRTVQAHVWFKVSEWGTLAALGERELVGQKCWEIVKHYFEKKGVNTFQVKTCELLITSCLCAAIEKDKLCAMCCEQQETRKPEGQPDPPLFTVLSAEVSISCTLPVNTKRSISQICRLDELFRIMKHFVCVLKPVPIVDDLKKKKHWEKHWI